MASLPYLALHELENINCSNWKLLYMANLMDLTSKTEMYALKENNV